MNSIKILHNHTFDKHTACAKAEEMLEDLATNYGLEINSDGEGFISFSGSGISGQVKIKHNIIELSATLSFLMIAMKPVIVTEIKKKLDKKFT
jgi:putative polyhydroxyalkanoate system protein